MADASLTVVARIRAKPGMAEQVKRELQALIAPTHAEPGCIHYDLHQSVEDPDQFLFHENWTSKEALETHLQQAHLKAFLDQADALLAEPVDVSLWNMISTPR